MKLRWSDRALEDYEYWRETDLSVWRHVRALIRHTQQEPFRGIGRPKALQHELKGWWSRQITSKDRLVYRVRRSTGGKRFLEILQCRAHY